MKISVLFSIEISMIDTFKIVRQNFALKDAGEITLCVHLYSICGKNFSLTIIDIEKSTPISFTAYSD